MEIREMISDDYQGIANIFQEGIRCLNATFHTSVPSFAEWDDSHLPVCRFVAINNGEVIGFTCLSKTSSREVYSGVCEVSIYVSEAYKKKGVGTSLLNTLIEDAKKHDIWMLQSVILEENKASYNLHLKCGFRVVGYRERIGRDRFNNWHNTILVEKRL